MLNQSTERHLPSTFPAPPTSEPPGPVPAPRVAGDIPDPPLDPASKRRRSTALSRDDKAILRSVLRQFQLAQADRATVVTSYLCGNCGTWHQDQTCRHGLCLDCSARIVELLAKLEQR